MASLPQGPTVATNVPPEQRKAGSRRTTYQPIPPTAVPPPLKQQPQEKQQQQQQQEPAKVDHYFGHEPIARLCGRFITHLFACPEYPPTTTHAQAKLPHFIAYALHRTKLHPSVTFAALVLLQRLKARFPTARGSSGHRLFISAFMIASKVICDDTYSNKSWSIVAQGMFTLREINQMEREMCNYLDWELTVDNPILSNFEKMVKQDFATDGAHPTYALHMVSKRAARAAASSSATPLPDPFDTNSPIPAFSPNNPTPIKTTGSPVRTRSSYPDSPTTPDTPSPSYSNSTSPASSASPATPMSVDEYNPKIQSFDSPRFSIVEKTKPTHVLKNKMYAFAEPAAW